MTKILLICFLLVAQSICAATYYVDWDAGSDINNGTSTGTPFKRPPGMATATGTAAATVLQSGDVVALKAGVVHYWDSVFIVRSGITVDGNLWGSGADAIIDGQSLLFSAFDAAANINGFTIRDLKIQNIGGYLESDPLFSGIEVASVDVGTDTITTTTDHSLVVGDDVQWTTTGTFPGGLSGGPSNKTLYYVISTPTPTTFTVSLTAGGALRDISSSGTGILKVWEPVTAPRGGIGIDMYDGGNDNVLIENVDFEKIGQWQNVPPMSGTGSVTGQGITIQGAEGVTIRGCNFAKMHNPVSLKVSGSTGGTINNILVDDCDISHCVWGIDISPRAAGTFLTNIEIKNTRIYDLHMYDSGNWLGFGEKPHTDFIFARVNYSSTWTPVKIHGCTFYSDNPGSTPGGTAAIYLSAGAPGLIYNNIFYNVRATRIIEITPDVRISNPPSVARIYNNLFYGGGIHILTDYETNPANKEMYIQNNIFVRDGAANSMMVARNGGLAPNLMNNNLYFSNIYTVDEKYVSSVVANAKFATLQAANWELDGAWGNPLLLGPTGTFAETNLRLGAGSAAIGLGANLSAYFTTDKDGNARPASGAWDVGPYVYDASPPVDATAPTLVSTTIGATGGAGTLVFDEPVQGVDLSHYAFSNGATLGGLSGSGTTWTFTVSPVVQAGQTVTLAYTSGAGRTRDLSDNLLATFSGTAVTNNSLEPTPDPPRAGRKGRGAGGMARPVGR